MLQNNVAEAGIHLDRAIALQRSILSEASKEQIPSQIVDSLVLLNDAVRTLSNTGNVVRAYSTCQEAEALLETASKTDGISSDQLNHLSGDTMLNSAIIHQTMGETQKALERCNRSVMFRRRCQGNHASRKLADALVALGGICAQMARSEEGIMHLEEALQLYEALTGAEADPVGSSLVGSRFPEPTAVPQECEAKIIEARVTLAECFGDLSQWGAATQQQQRALQQYTDKFGSETRRIGSRFFDPASIMETLAAFHTAAQDPGRPEELLREAVSIRRKQEECGLAADSELLLNALRNLGRALQSGYHKDEAAVVWKEVLVLEDKHFDPKQSDSTEAAERVVEALHNICSASSNDEQSDLLSLTQRAIAISTDFDLQEELASSHTIRGALYLKRDDKSKALESFKTALELRNALVRAATEAEEDPWDVHRKKGPSSQRTSRSDKKNLEPSQLAAPQKTVAKIRRLESVVASLQRECEDCDQ